MIISRTPFRISFVGGGTDLRSFYTKEPGQVLSTSIDKYIYVLVKRQIAEVSVVSKGSPAVLVHDVLGNFYVSIDDVLRKSKNI